MGDWPQAFHQGTRGPSGEPLAVAIDDFAMWVAVQSGDAIGDAIGDAMLTMAGHASLGPLQGFPADDPRPLKICATSAVNRAAPCL